MISDFNEEKENTIGFAARAVQELIKKVPQRFQLREIVSLPNCTPSHIV